MPACSPAVRRLNGVVESAAEGHETRILPCGMDTIGQQDHIQAAGTIHPERGAGKAGVTIGAVSKQISCRKDGAGPVQPPVC